MIYGIPVEVVAHTCIGFGVAMVLCYMAMFACTLCKTRQYGVKLAWSAMFCSYVFFILFVLLANPQWSVR